MLGLSKINAYFCSQIILIMHVIYQTVKPFNKLLKPQKVKKGEEYRPMYYVVEQPVDEGLLLYHTMTKAMLLLTPEEAEVYKTHPTDLPQLIEQWFLVPQSHDDRLLSRQIRDVARMLEKKTDAITSYTILTTTDCNARCFYCYEMGRPRVNMNKETAEKTADYIINHCQGAKVLLRWFGGEPLYNKTVITLICNRLKEAGVDYSSNMTSNGYLFDENTIAEAKELWKLKKVQITLDGTEKTYNHCKAYIYKNVNAYHRVIGNIHRLQNADIHVSIRLNIDMHNAENLSELADELHREFSSPEGITVYLHMLFEQHNRLSTIKDKKNRRYVFSKIREIDTKLKEYGFSKNEQLYSKIKTNKCMADNDSSIVIVPNGHIGKCEHYSEDHFIGHLLQKERNQELLESFRETRDEIKACTTCILYPNCIWLKLCEDKPHCYEEERKYRQWKIKQSISRIYQKYHNKEQNELQD